MKKRLSKKPRYVIAALAAAVTVASAVWAAQLSPGDVDQDGRVSTRDAVKTVRYSVGLETPSQEQFVAGDIAPWVGWGQPLGDGKLDAKDALRTLSYLVGLMPSEEYLGVTNGTYVGAKACEACHAKAHAGWSATGHAKAFDALKNASSGDKSKDPNCVGCHVVGYGQGGFVDEQTTPGLAGVQCESCHGPGSEHIKTGDKTKILAFPNNVSALVCGRCHKTSHSPQLQDWDKSLHREIEGHVAGYFRDEKNVDTCGPCHSGDYRLAMTLGRPTPKGKEIQFSQTCAVCHDPHGKTGNDPIPQEGHDAQLRMSTVSQSVDQPNLCGQCHHRRTDDTPEKTSRPPHHSPQFSFLLGEGGVTDSTESIRTSHSMVPGQCVHCHMSGKPYESEEKPAMTGHLFRPDVRACATCHGDQGETMKTALQTTIKSSLAALKARLDKYGAWEYVSNGGPQDQSTLPQGLKEARFNYYYITNEGSFGIHNAKYARKLIEVANAKLDALGVPQ